ncbi:uncharacterized protein F4812DRAFT_440808 [Daldinia caldariorum]|uniref:uncharacterized protein n=1 Tax=Daldinia caldariorum TaxID=326644 RepID=UPI002007B97A|nr:uncharacterized protein F4812DRAFT_440808 [Daldinia caldariorum]KAI1464877.1 hypothetical protein F4812DRAFT_440808 [Daldinia caldariorum]
MQNDDTAEFLVDHLKKDIFEIRPQKMPISFLRRVPRRVNDPEHIGRPSDVENRDGNKGRVTMKLSIAALSRMRMRKLQIELTNRIMRMHFFKELPEDWENLLEKYITATRDNDYIKTCVDRGMHDPFLIKSERKVDAAVLQAALSEIPAEKLDKGLFNMRGRGRTPKFNLVPPLEKTPTAIGDEMIQKQRTEEFVTRVIVSAIGGAFLIVPVWIMVLVKSTYTSLITTTVFVFVGGFAAAAVLKDNLQVVSVTAAYAAVLVVFVGANGPST